MGICNVGAIDSKAGDVRPETGDSRRAHSGYLYLCRLWIDKKRERCFARRTYWFGAHQALVACVYWTYLPLKIGARLSTNAVMPSM